jgi:hypothetical protein
MSRVSTAESGNNKKARQEFEQVGNKGDSGLYAIQLLVWQPAVCRPTLADSNV